MVVPSDVQEAYRRWPGESRQYVIDSHRDAIAGVSASVLEGVKALPRRGLEVSGLFLGDVSEGGRRIETIVPLTSDYPQGPMFRAGRPYLEAAVSAAAKGGRIVGVYRSRTDGENDLDGQDELLLDCLRAFAPLVVIVIAQTSSTPAKARAGMWDGSKVEWFEAGVLLNDWLTDGHARRSDLPAKRSSKPSLTIAAAACLGLAVVISMWPRSNDQLERLGDSLSGRRAVFGSNNPPLRAAEAKTAPQREEEAKTRERKNPTSDDTVFGLPERPASVKPPVRPMPTFQPRSIARSEPEGIEVASALPAPPQISLGPNVAAQPLPAPAAPVQYSVQSPAAPYAATAVTFVEPVLARQTTPIVIPPGLRRLLARDVVIALNLTIDASGRVIAADRIGNLDRVEESLWGVYARAVSQWRFDPARRNEMPVQAKTTLRFRVTAGQP